MTAINLLEKIGADAAFDQSLLSVEEKKTLEDIINKAKTFNALEIILAPDEEEIPEEETEGESEKEKNV
jgi:hypothetical protein